MSDTLTSPKVQGTPKSGRVWKETENSRSTAIGKNAGTSLRSSFQLRQKRKEGKFSNHIVLFFFNTCFPFFLFLFSLLCHLSVDVFSL